MDTFQEERKNPKKVFEDESERKMPKSNTETKTGTTH
jgi:hypothetical protein